MGLTRRTFLRNATGSAVALTAAPRSTLGAPAPSDVYVSPAGSDSNPGTRERPLSSLAAAQAIARKKAPGKSNKKIFLRGGVYYLPQTLVLTATDSNTIWQAYADEEVTVSGGQRLSLDWQSDGSPILFAKVPAGLRTDQLFVNGQLQILARYPNFNAAATYFDGYGALDPARAARYRHPETAFVHAMHSSMWGSLHYRVTGRNPDGSLKLEGGWQTNRPAEPHPQYRFIENVREELDAPGEWFLDNETDTLYFYPPASLSSAQLKSAIVEVPVLKALVELRGSGQEPATGIHWRNVVFRHALRTFMETREPLLRSDWTIYRGGTFLFEGTQNCSVSGCTFDRLGGNAVFFSNFNRSSRVVSSEIFEAGASGVCFVGDPAAVRSPLFRYEDSNDAASIDRTAGPRTENYPLDCSVEDTLIHRIGRIEKQAAGVEISMSAGIAVRGCSIYDVPRAGINIGDGCWGGHTIAGCDVFDTVKETGDHGSFNSWGRDRYWNLRNFDPNRDGAADQFKIPLLDTIQPITLRHNRWRCDHGWDIDLDDGSTNYHIVDNLCLAGGLKLREGFRRVCENNVVVDNGLSAHVWFEDSGDAFRNNIVFAPYKPILVKKWSADIDYNLLHVPGLRPAVPATELRAFSHQDRHSLKGDALFIDPASGDYRVKPGSPALACGFRNFRMDDFGVRSARLRAKARTPELPKLQGASAPAAATPDLDWLGSKIHTIRNQDEMSAFGAPGITGALIVQLPRESAAAKAGFLQNDLILRFGDASVQTAEDLFILTLQVFKTTQITVSGLRNQRPFQVSIKLP